MAPSAQPARLPPHPVQHSQCFRWHDNKSRTKCPPVRSFILRCCRSPAHAWPTAKKLKRLCFSDGWTSILINLMHFRLCYSCCGARCLCPALFSAPILRITNTNWKGFCVGPFWAQFFRIYCVLACWRRWRRWCCPALGWCLCARCSS